MDNAQPVPAPAPAPAPEAAPAPAPVPSATPAPAGAPRTYISNPVELIKPSLEAFKLSWLNLLLLVLAVIGISIAFVALTFVLGPLVLILAVLALPITLYIIGFAGWTAAKLTIAAARGHKLTFKEALPQKFSEPWKYVWTGIVYGLVVILGLILFIVPGIIFIGWFSLATYATVDEGLTGPAALKRARELSKGRTWDVLGANFLTSAIGIIALIPVIGLIIYVVLAFILIPVMAVRYVQVVELKKTPGWESVPTHPLNYVVLIVGIVASGLSSSSNFNQSLQNLQNQSKVENNLKAY